MKILVVAHDIPASKAHLMPWRTACEVTDGLRNLGNDVTLVSLDSFSGTLEGENLPKNSLAIRKQRAYLATDLKYLEQSCQPDVVFWPVSWRDPGFRIEALEGISAKVIGWFPGGEYDKKMVAYALYRLGIRKALPYLREAWALKRRQANYWRDSGIQSLLAMTPYTANSAIKSGYPANQVFSIPPGREDVEKEPEAGDLDTDLRQWLNGRKYFLFMGPPSAIRGIFELLAAFEMAAKQDDSICLICLFRSDGELDRDRIDRRIMSMSFRGRVYVRWESVSPGELNTFIREGFATVMPFVLVPSEIPLAVIETARWGRPVITTGPGGTGSYVEQFGLAPKVGDVNALARAMLTLSSNSELYQSMSEAAVQIYKDHPTWRQVSRQWFGVASVALGASQ